MPVVNISEEANEILKLMWEKNGLQKKWLASKCVIDHADEYVKKDDEQ